MLAFLKKQEYDHKRKRYLKIFLLFKSPENKIIVCDKHILG